MERPKETRRATRSRQRPTPVRMIIAVWMLLLATPVVWIGQVCANASHLLAGDRTLRTWRKMMQFFHSGSIDNGRLPLWEQNLLRVGPSIVLAIMSALTVLWTLIGVGGALFWLVIHGYGFALLLGTVVLGLVIGGRIARVRRSVRHDLN